MDEENAEENLKAFKEKQEKMLKYSLFQQLFMKVLIKYYMLLQMLQKLHLSLIWKKQKKITVVYNYEEEEAPFVVHNLGNGQWTITGKKIERLVSMTSLVSDDAIKRLSIKMRNMGIDEALRNAGCQDGDVVSILDFEFEFYD